MIRAAAMDHRPRRRSIRLLTHRYLAHFPDQTENFGNPGKHYGLGQKAGYKNFSD
jgi:hypothetical protein